MAHVQLKVENRDVVGNQVRKLRRDGIIPGVIYGNKVKEPINIKTNRTGFVKIFQQVGKTGILDVSVDGGKSIPCIIQDMDIHPVKSMVRHVDLIAVDLKQKTTTEVPLVFVGTSQAVEDGGLLNTVLELVEIEALPEDFPDQLEVDISALDSFDAVLHASSLTIPKGCTLITPPEETLASIQQAATGVEEAPVAAEEVAVEGEGGEEAGDSTEAEKAE